MDISEDSGEIKSEDLTIIRKRKVQDEIRTAIRIHQKKIEPLEIADKFMHNIFELIKDGISNNFPELSEADLIRKIRDTLSLNLKIRSLRIKR